MIREAPAAVAGLAYKPVSGELGAGQLLASVYGIPQRFEKEALITLRLEEAGNRTARRKLLLQLCASALDLRAHVGTIILELNDDHVIAFTLRPRK
jgi:hypothetical protein